MEKPATAFDAGRRQCKRCRLDQKKNRYDPARQKKINDRASWKVRAARYGTTEAALLEMWREQEYRCAICRRDDLNAPHVDHCHATGRVRGLLCASCNRVLGLMRDNPTLLRRAAQYLDNYTDPF